MCDIGSTDSEVSVSRNSITFELASTLARMLAWDSFTPLGLPVVPEV